VIKLILINDMILFEELLFSKIPILLLLDVVLKAAGYVVIMHKVQ